MKKEHIIELLETHKLWVDEGGGVGCQCNAEIMYDWEYSAHLIVLIKGEK